MLKKLLMTVAAGLIAASSYAVEDDKLEKTYELKDGTTVHIYKDGKMAMSDKSGRPRSMKEGEIMETKDGEKLMMKGNEIWRVERRHQLHRGG